MRTPKTYLHGKLISHIDRVEYLSSGYPHQEIKEERVVRSNVALFEVGSLDAIINILKGWLPDIKIIQPEELKNMLLSDMKSWIVWQEGS